MRKSLASAATLGAMGLMLGFTATQAAAAPSAASTITTQTSSSGAKNYTCTNQGGGPNHKVTCIGTINGNNVTVNVGDINVLSGNSLALLQNVLNDVTVQIANLNVDAQIKAIEATVATFYLNTLHIPISVDDIQVCIAAKCG